MNNFVSLPNMWRGSLFWGLSTGRDFQAQQGHWESLFVSVGYQPFIKWRLNLQIPISSIWNFIATQPFLIACQELQLNFNGKVHAQRWSRPSKSKPPFTEQMPIINSHKCLILFIYFFAKEAWGGTWRTRLTQWHKHKLVCYRAFGPSILKLNWLMERLHLLFKDVDTY